MREIKSIQVQIAPVTDLPTESELAKWLNHQAGQHNLTCALAFADDGVIWGRFDGAWKWSDGAFGVSPPFRLNTLQQIRLFGTRAELFLWRAERNWQGRVITEGAGKPHDYFEEKQLLWGNPDGEPQAGFWLMRDEGQGLQHTPPAHIARAGRLLTRAYLDDDKDGCVKIIATRLVDTQEEMSE